MTPDDFKFDLMECAYALVRSANAMTASHVLDAETSVWLITESAWREFQHSQDVLQGYASIDFRTSRKTLLGVPVRITIEDEAGIPPVQLLMKPLRRVTRPRL